MECMFTAQGPSVLHAIEVAVVQFAQVQLVIIIMPFFFIFPDSFESASSADEVCSNALR